MPKGENIRLYYILAVVFAILAVGVFLFPGVPQNGLGWIIKALAIVAFGVFVWVLLQDLQISVIAANESIPETKDLTEEPAPPPTFSQLDINLSSEQDTGSSPENLVDATQAYNTFLNRVLRVVHETLVSHAAMLYITDASRGNLVLQESHTRGDVQLKNTIPLGDDLLSQAFLENTSVIVADDGDESGTQSNHYAGEQSPDIQSLLAVPLRYHNQCIGVLAVDETAKNNYSPDDSKLLQQYAEIISSAMVQLDMLDQLSDQKRLYSRLCQVNSRLSLTDSQEDLLQQIIQVNRNLFNYDSVTVILLQSQDSTQAEVAAVDGKIKHPGKGYRFELKESALNRVIQSGQPLLIPQINEETSVRQLLPELRGEFTEVQSLMIIPVQSHSEIFGALVLESHNPGNFSEQDQDILMMVGSVFGAGLNRFYLYRYMKNIATKDELTGVSNYRAFKERLEEEIQRSERYQSPFTLFIADLDKFKRINDSHGHLYGDYMLKEVARIITESVRNIDMVARYGGEEFAVILVKATADDSVKTANRIREGIKNYHFEKDGIKERITISIGIAEYPSHAEDTQHLIECADEAMYKVKQIGGNAVETFQTTTQTEEE